MFLGIPDKDQVPLVRGMDRIRILLRIRNLLKSCKNRKKNLDFYYYLTLFDFLSMKNDENVSSKSNQQKKLC
jgi:hypothetical protein